MQYKCCDAAFRLGHHDAIPVISFLLAKRGGTGERSRHRGLSASWQLISRPMRGQAPSLSHASSDDCRKQNHCQDNQNWRCKFSKDRDQGCRTALASDRNVRASNRGTFISERGQHVIACVPLTMSRIKLPAGHAFCDLLRDKLHESAQGRHTAKTGVDDEMDIAHPIYATALRDRQNPLSRKSVVWGRHIGGRARFKIQF